MPDRIIFLTAADPLARNSGAKIRETELIRLLSEKYEIEVLTSSETLTGGAVTQLITPRVSLTQVPRLKPSVLKRLFVSPILEGLNPHLEDALRIRARGHKPLPLLWVSRLRMAQYIPLARSLGFQVVLDEQNVGASLQISTPDHPLRSLFNSMRGALRSAETRYLRERYCSACHCVVASSHTDAQRLSKIVPNAPSRVVPNFIDLSLYESPTGPEKSGAPGTLLFPGSLDFAPNLRGLGWFAAEVLPRLRRGLGTTLPRIVAAGARPSADTIHKLQQAGIEVVADPPSMIPLLRAAEIVILPSEGLSVNRISILEAMASGKAVVTTGEGVDGLAISPTYDVLIADNEDAFASAISRLLRDPAERKQLGEHARDTVKRRHSPQAVRAALEEVIWTAKSLDVPVSDTERSSPPRPA